jgi:secretion/DNA translocation related TadE-like protein
MDERPSLGEQGAASVVVLAAGVLLSAMALAVGLLATGLTAHRQAVRAADLAALAGAQRSLADASVACRWARSVAEANGALLEKCWLNEGSVRVQVTVPTAPLLPVIRATARAGLMVS